MKKVLVFGATGKLGGEICKALKKQNYYVMVAVRNQKNLPVNLVLDEVHIVDFSKWDSIEELIQKANIIISSLGKSVAMRNFSKGTFREIDFLLNKKILTSAQKYTSVEQFIYVSAFLAEHYTHLEYFKTHQDFADALVASGINYAIIKPPALFSALFEILEMCRFGLMGVIGKGDAKTNPIYEGDVAEVIANSVGKQKQIIELGGCEVITRKEIVEIAFKALNKKPRIVKTPAFLVRLFLPLLRIFGKNMYDKISFYAAVMQKDAIAPAVGKTKLYDYFVKQLAR